MGRIAGAFGMGILRGCVVYAFAAVYVLVVTTVFFFLPLGRAVSQLEPGPEAAHAPAGSRRLLSPRRADPPPRPRRSQEECRHRRDLRVARPRWLSVRRPVPAVRRVVRRTSPPGAPLPRAAAHDRDGDLRRDAVRHHRPCRRHGVPRRPRGQAPDPLRGPRVRGPLRLRRGGDVGASPRGRAGRPGSPLAPPALPGGLRAAPGNPAAGRADGHVPPLQVALSGFR